ncbi:polyamine-transporting ATPase 13A3-like isoform X2 [Liolophura sinensis]|uniref:polyamine-transporting ATPase 13A3-like isoform X2 n=1 Tax=Liolophura sinensis TaxID=3198878 RepID=UPI003158DDFC
MTRKEDPKIKVGRTGPPPMDPLKTYINPGTEEQMEIIGYRLVRLRQILTWGAILLTVGLLRLIFHWKPEWMIWATHCECPLSEAEIVTLQDMYNQLFVANVMVMTKDGTRVKVLQPGLFSRPRRTSRSKLLVRDTFQQDATSAGDQDVLVAPFKDESLLRFFWCKKLKYLWSNEKQMFSRVYGLDMNTSCSYFHACKGLSYVEQYRKRLLYGNNMIAVHVTPILVLLFQQALNPFYVFQVFSCSLWFADEYYYYASTIVVISVISLSTTIYQTRKMQRALRNTITSSTVMTVCRGDEVFEDLSSEDLVPGDVIEIPRNGCVMQCDAVLLSGNVIVNESMLTGESVPVTKTPIPNPRGLSAQDLPYNIKEHSRHTLFCGTHVIQTRYYDNQKVLAVVIRTGFSTAKGDLVRSILYPKPVDFKFNRDTYLFIGVLAGISALGFIYTVVLMVRRGNDASDVVIRALDLITIAVPPALPAAMTVGIVFAQARLKRNAIYCISPRSINVCGSLNVVCFDKTGTLTEDGLDFQGVVPVRNAMFDQHHSSLEKLSGSPLLIAMATCHSLTIIDGVLSGDPLDLIMFGSTDWVLEEPGMEETRFDMMIPTVVRPRTSHHITANNGTTKAPEVGIMRQFTFSSSLQRMSVIARTLGNSNFDLYAKGAPEMITSLLPSNFHEVLMGYTQHGYRVLALAWKPLPTKLNYVKIQRVQREQVEKGLTLVGLLIMENQLKPESTPVIHQLREANIRTIMVTGDNMLTALSVARECGMVGRTDRIVMVNTKHNAGLDSSSKEPTLEFIYADDKEKHVEEVFTSRTAGDGTRIQIDDDNPQFHFALMGRSWEAVRKHFPEVLCKIVVRGAVFARMTPDQKAQLIEVLQELGYYVGMCGDGANDCGALKTAHAGISLSEAEASVASPFTSKKPNIECVPTMIREGRAALVTSFGVFKYMAGYSLTQFVSVCLLYWISNNLTDFQFLYIDLFLITTLGITFGRTAAYKELVREVPPVSLLTVPPIMSLLIHAAIQTAAQTGIYFYVMEQPWFTPFEPNEEEEYKSYENTAVYLVSSFQYITLAIIFSKGAPYRKNLFTNYLFMVNIVLCVAISILCVMYPPEFLSDLLELKPPPSLIFRLVILGISLANFFLCLIVESFLIDSYFLRKRCQKILERWIPSSKYQYSAIEQEITESNNWPPVSASSTNLVDALDGKDSNYEMTAGKLGGRYDEDSLDGFDSSSVRTTSEKGSPIVARTAKRGADGDGIKISDGIESVDSSDVVVVDSGEDKPVVCPSGDNSPINNGQDQPNVPAVELNTADSSKMAALLISPESCTTNL